jgi:hypothetical protein
MNLKFWRPKHKEDFDKDKPIEEKTGAMALAEWGKKYHDHEGVKSKKSLNEEKGMIRLHLSPFFGSMLLTQITRESLGRYINQRMGETTLRHERRPRKRSCAARSRMNFVAAQNTKVAAREGYQISMPSFERLIVRVKAAVGQ